MSTSRVKNFAPGKNFTSIERTQANVIQLKITNAKTQLSSQKILKHKSQMSSVNRSLNKPKPKKGGKKNVKAKYGSNKPSPQSRYPLAASKKSKLSKMKHKENQWTSPWALKIGFKNKRFCDTDRSQESSKIRNAKVFSGKDKANYISTNKQKRRNRDERMKKGKHVKLQSSDCDYNSKTSLGWSPYRAKINLDDHWNVEHNEGSERKGHISIKFRPTKPIGFRA